MSHCPSHNRPLSEGKRARTSTCKSVCPTTLKVYHQRGSPIKDTSGDGGSNHHHVSPPGAKTVIDVGGTKASIASVPITFPGSWVGEQQELIIDGFLDVVQV